MTSTFLARPSARLDGPALGTFAAGLGGAAFAAYLLLHGPWIYALAFCALPLFVWLVERPAAAVVPLFAAIPIMYDLTGGRGGFHLAISDVLLSVAFAGIVLGGMLAGAVPSAHVLKPAKNVVLQYAIVLAILLSVHVGLKDVAQTGQRLELFAFPLIVGAFTVLAGKELAALKAYIVGASVLAVLWAVSHDAILGQKYPVGQMIGNALLLLVGLPPLRRYAPFGLVLIPGLLLTGSRGAVLGTFVGLVVILALQESRGRMLFKRLTLVALVGFVAYALVPASLQQRLTNFSAGTGSQASYANRYRQQYAKDAEHLIGKHPVVGVGVGNYVAGSARDLTLATDPHNFLLLQAAEGGIGFALSFVVLIGGVALALRRMTSVPIAPVAAGVFLATFVHGLVDVYWVRGTPVLGWLLVGMACAAYANRDQHARGQG
jgi:hypothetical protein